MYIENVYVYNIDVLIYNNNINTLVYFVRGRDGVTMNFINIYVDKLITYVVKFGTYIYTSYNLRIY